MSHRSRWSLLALPAAFAIVFAACTPSASPSASGAASPSASASAGSPSASASSPAAAMRYPEEGEVTCAEGETPGEFNGAEYSGKLKSIEAPDPMTVVFTMCGPDVAFLQKAAFSVFAVNDAEWIRTKAEDGTIKDSLNGTGPYKLDEWRRGDSLIYSANESYWNEEFPKVPNAVLRWASESGARLQALQSGQVQGITLVGPADYETVSNDTNLQLSLPPAGENLNTLFIGMNHNVEPWDDVNVRRAVALAVDRQRIVTNFYPDGSEVATHFTPCAIEFGCEGDPWFETGTEAAREEARSLLEAAGVGDLTTSIQYRNVFRGYLPQPPLVAQDLAEQLQSVGITATVEEQESGTFINAANAGELEGIFLLGWGADYPEVTNFMDYHFGPSATSAFGTPYPEVAGPLSEGNSTSDEAARATAYEAANNALQEVVPMLPVAHGAFANAWVAGAQGGLISPISNEVMWAVQPPSGDQVVLMQNAEPIGLYCADETDGESLRACEQAMEGLYGYAPGTAEVEPALANECTPNDDASVWTCTLREGVTFHDGSTFDAEDVILSFAVQWDATHPLHKGNTSAFEYWGGLWLAYLNQPPE
jgi:peptide/nickel transport system substrate-binding protein